MQISDSKETHLSESELDSCLNVLHRLARHPALCEGNDTAFKVLLAAKELEKSTKRLRKDQTKQRDRDVSGGSEIRVRLAQRSIENGAALSAALIDDSEKWPAAQHISQDETGSVTGSETPAMPALAKYIKPVKCYVCKSLFTERHHFYSQLCKTCAQFNYEKRSDGASLHGKTAVVTGARIKIGYQIALRLLRNGARVVATTRFPANAIATFSGEPDFAQWQDRLIVYGLDLRSFNAVGEFVDFMFRQGSLDILINNAAQTIARPAAFYKELARREMELPESFSVETKRILQTPIVHRSSISQITKSVPDISYESGNAIVTTDMLSMTFPNGFYDTDGQQLDLRTENSWTAPLDQVSLPELLEAHTINALSPFMLISRLMPLFRKHSENARFIINVSAAEGQFSSFKREAHAHTNMAKAALNMLTRTCADALSAEGIYMNSVDTGWISNQYPHVTSQAMRIEGWHPPLDAVDGAARVLAPIFNQVNTGAPTWGLLFKDYRQTSW